MRRTFWRFTGPLLVLVGFAAGYVSLAHLLSASRRGTYEAAAILHLKQIQRAEEQYRLSEGFYGDAASLVRAHLLDVQLGSSADRYIAVDGYLFELGSIGNRYIATAKPATSDGGYGYYMREDGVIHYELGSALSPPGMAGAPIEAAR